MTNTAELDTLPADTQEPESAKAIGTATYSPDDNKLRLYPFFRLDAAIYARVKAAGFKWAPKQELFVAPKWTPEREDLLTALCGQIDDEDKNLVERAEERAARFEDYSEKRAADANAAHAAVRAIADNIPFGQPILIGHHSERRARKDAERIQNGMRQAVRLWDTSQYWVRRAKGAIRHAKYKERPDVRQRRIRTLEAEQRKVERGMKEARLFLKLWTNLSDDTKWKAQNGQLPTVRERALFISNRDHISQCFTLDRYPRQRPASQYEGPMSLWGAIDCDVITAEQAKDIAIAVHEQRIATAERWLAHLQNRLAYERAMLEDAGGIETDRVKPEIGGAIRCLFSPGYGRGWAYIVKVNRISVSIREWPKHARQPISRTIPFDNISGIMTADQVRQAREDGRLLETPDSLGFYLRTNEPEPAPATPSQPPAAEAEDNAPDFDRLRETLRAGVKVVAAPQLFPTPAELVARMVELARIEPGHSILEPSAGTGAILAGLPAGRTGRLVAVEINAQLAAALHGKADEIRCADFLACHDLGRFDRVLMNPPFADGVDIKHVKHAAAMLQPGGRLVAICANGPRQNDLLRPLAAIWESLPPGSFKGTAVDAALLVIEA